MLGYTLVSRLPKTALVLLGFVAACTPRTLTLVDLYSDGGPFPSSLDGNPGNAFDAISSDRGLASSLIDGNSGEASDGASATTLRYGLVGLWHLDDAVGSKVAIDSSGNHNDGTLVGLDPPAQPWVAGRLNGALDTNGVGYVSVADSDSIDSITAQVTVSAWVYLDGVISVADGYGTALSRQIGTTDEQYYHLSLNQESIPTLFIGFSASIPAAVPTAPQTVALRHWTHLAGTYDGSVATLYVDGVKAGSRSISGVFPLDTRPVILGGNGNKLVVTELFPGRIDEVALYNRALSPDEISLLATAVAL